MKNTIHAVYKPDEQIKVNGSAFGFDKRLASIKNIIFLMYTKIKKKINK